MKSMVEEISETLDKLSLNFSINKFSSSFDKEEAVDFPTDNSYKKSTMDEDEDAEEHYVGLVNQAMTCYLNSLLQALYMTPEFRNALYNWKYVCSENDEEALNVPFQLQKLFLNLQTSYKSSIETNFLTESFGWDPSEAWQQHDIQEFCRDMFDTLEQKLKNTEQADLIHKLYEGKICDYIKCLNCNTVKSREDTFLTIPLSVRPFDANETCGSVEEALKAFVKNETLEGNDQYFCQKCYKKTNAQKRLKFAKFPYILMLQLKRFDFNQSTNRRRKLNDKITFPEILNLDSFIESASNPESPSLEEDAGLCVKCDDSCITDNSIMDEECAPSNTTDSNNHFTYHDQLEDEGIVMNNDMFQSHSSLNQDHDQLQKKYIYELFSIMIHSGNARSGHYYAYIKDFRTGKWLCFNDQKVTSITSEDIQKTYGGAYCARSSTNAYMLMYRQIDPEHNRLPMKAEDFPVHIKELVEKMKNEDISTMPSHQQNPSKPIYCENPSTDLMKSANVSRHITFADIDENGCKSGSEEAIKSDKDERETKSKKKMKENKKAVKVGTESRKKTSSSLTSKKNETSLETKAKVQTKKKIQAKRTDIKKRFKKACDSGSDSSSEILRSRNRSTRKARLYISSHNPKPLRRSAYLLRSNIRNYYSFESDDSPRAASNVSNFATTK